jgi:hypothetical protein
MMRIIYGNARLIYGIFASYGRCLLAHLLAKAQMMKCALSVGILAVSIGAEGVNAQAYSPYSAS